jgi:hypothetical protein
MSGAIFLLPHTPSWRANGQMLNLPGFNGVRRFEKCTAEPPAPADGIAIEIVEV